MNSASSCIIHYGQNSIEQSRLVCLLEAEMGMFTNMIHNNARQNYFRKTTHFFVQILYVGRIRNVRILSNVSSIKSVDLLQQKTRVLFTLISACTNCTQPAPVLLSALSGPYCPLCSLCSGSNDERGVDSATPPPKPPLSLHNTKWFWKQTANLTIWFLIPIISTVFLSPTATVTEYYQHYTCN